MICTYVCFDDHWEIMSFNNLLLGFCNWYDVLEPIDINCGSKILNLNQPTITNFAINVVRKSLLNLSVTLQISLNLASSSFYGWNEMHVCVNPKDINNYLRNRTCIKQLNKCNSFPSSLYCHLISILWMCVVLTIKCIMLKVTLY